MLGDGIRKGSHRICHVRPDCHVPDYLTLTIGSRLHFEQFDDAALFDAQYSLQRSDFFRDNLAD
jgi:hypothetical protein